VRSSTAAGYASTFFPDLRSWPDLRLWIALGLALLFHAALWGHYRPYNIDDPWFLSYSYNLCHRQSELDLAFGGKFPNGMGGTIAFGKLAAYVQCGFFDLFGWTRMTLEMLSRIVSFAGLGLLGVFLSRIGIGKRVVLCLLAAFAVLEPFFGMASQARYDSVTFLLLSAALTLACYQWWLPAGFVAAAAMEIQPIGILVPVITFFFLITVPGGRQGRFRAGAALLAGGVLFVPVYFLLHPNIFNAFNLIDEVNAARFQHAGFLYSYFWETQYKRHLPELAVFSASIILCLTRWRDERRRFALICTITVAASSFILKWPNYNYTVFWYWAALLLLFQMAETYRRASWICLIAAVYMLPQYGFVFAKNRNAGFSAADFSALRTAIGQAAGTSQAITVYGDYTLWFAMPETFIMANRMNLGLAKDAVIVTCFDEQLVKDPLMLTCPEIEAATDLVPAGELDLGGARVRLFKVRAAGHERRS
jgi:hypothetical protein